MLPIIPHDKALHVIYGGVIALITLVVASAVSLAVPALWALGASVIIGAAKEVYDRKSGKGNPEYGDFYATGIGGLAIALAGLL